MKIPNKPTILIVDDLRENLLQLSQLLKPLSAEVFQASNFSEALAITNEKDLALIILDVEMPDVNGYELANMIKKSEKNKFTPIIFLSAVFFDEMHIYKGYETGAVDYLTKPLNREILLSKVTVFLGLEQIRSDLKRSEALYHSIVEDQTDLVFRSGPDYNITYANAAFCNLLNKSQEQLIGTNMFEIVASNDLDTAHNALRSLSPAGSIAKFNHRIETSGAEEKWVNHSLRAFFNQGQIIEFQSVCHDITDLKHLNAELVAAREKAEEETKLKSMFLANMSHEIRTPMSGILSLAEMLKTTPLNEEQAESTNLICQSAATLLSIINDILDFSKIEANQVTIHPTECRIADILNDVAGLFRTKAAEKNNRIFVAIDPKIPERVILDPLKTIQILNNLVNNALKFTQNGSVNISCTILSKEDSGLKLKFSIQDTGAGIESSQLSRLFQPYVQANHNQLTNAGGTGLGLAICKRLVEKMHGEIGVQSTPGKGSEFWFTITAEVAGIHKEIFTTATFQGIYNSGSHPLHVLIVEDNLLNQKVASATLRKLGHTTDFADNGQIGYNKFLSNHYDLIVMDIQMPVMNGLDTTRAIRLIENERNAGHTKIIALTANVTEGYRQACIEAGMDDFICKPFRFDDFAKTISKHYNASKINE
jgi:PAS domain S-box-containing protein